MEDLFYTFDEEEYMDEKDLLQRKLKKKLFKL
jgi:hypothetical protein